MFSKAFIFSVSAPKSVAWMALFSLVFASFFTEVEGLHFTGVPIKVDRRTALTSSAVSVIVELCGKKKEGERARQVQEAQLMNQKRNELSQLQTL